MKTIRMIVRGCGTLPICGPHPGTGFIAMLFIMGLAAGSHGGWFGSLCGAGAMLAFFGPIYLYGAYERAKHEEQNEPHR